MKYIRKFDTVSAYTSAELDYPNMSYIVEDDSIRLVKTAPPPPHDYSQDYLTLEALESGTFSYEFKDDTWFYYSTDGGENWDMYDIGSSPISVSSGDTVMFYGELSINYGYGIGTFSSTGDFKVYGNAMSLFYGHDFSGETSLYGKDYAFKELFSGCTGLTDASNLVLPATTLAANCYDSMFYGCQSLTAAPALPATTLANYCYNFMFADCTALPTAPTLPATTLTEYCYAYMFNECGSLTASPVLPAPTLADGCYCCMFQESGSFVEVTCLATDISATDCTYCWLEHNGGGGTFYKAAGMTSWTLNDDCGVPRGWTVQDYQG